MSKTHSKENSLFTDTASTAIVGELESRLRELEKNIAVAHEFIKLADESYNQVRHEWDLLQNDTPASTKKSLEFPSFPTASKHEDEDTFEDIPSFKEKKHSSHEKAFKSFGPTISHTPSLGAKPETTSTKKKDGKESTETKTNEPEQKESKPTRHRKGKGTSSKN